MANNNQSIVGNNNIQIAGDIKTEKIIRKTEVIYDEKLHITEEQAKNIRDKIQKIAEEKYNNSRAFSQAYNSLYNRFKITSYKLLPKDKYDEAIEWLNKQIAINRKSLKKIDHDRWRKDLYKAIHAKSREFNIEIHSYATIVLKLKAPIDSLTELSDARLKRLYNHLFGL